MTGRYAAKEGSFVDASPCFADERQWNTVFPLIGFAEVIPGFRRNIAQYIREKFVWQDGDMTGAGIVKFGYMRSHPFLETELLV